MQNLLSTLLMIIVPLAAVLAGLLSWKREHETWWSKLLIVLGLVLIALVFLVQIQK